MTNHLYTANSTAVLETPAAEDYYSVVEANYKPGPDLVTTNIFCDLVWTSLNGWYCAYYSHWEVQHCAPLTFFGDVEYLAWVPKLLFLAYRAITTVPPQNWIEMFETHASKYHTHVCTSCIKSAPHINVPWNHCSRLPVLFNISQYNSVFLNITQYYSFAVLFRVGLMNGWSGILQNLTAYHTLLSMLPRSGCQQWCLMGESYPPTLSLSLNSFHSWLFLTSDP